MKSEGVTSIVTTAFNKWADKLWFQILAIVVVIYLLAAPILGPVITNYTNRETMSETISTTLDSRDDAIRESHKRSFEESREAYALAKHKMQDYLTMIGADYVFLLEYHNGNENIMTGIQFCRFDITIEVSDVDAAYVPLEKFKDDIVVRYDLLLSDELNSNKLLHYKKADFERVDKYFAYQLQYVDAQSFAILNLRDKDGKVFGTLLCLSTDEERMNLLAVHELAGILEEIFNKNIYR